MNIVLASTSKYRQELLLRILPNVKSLPPLFDEDKAKRGLEGMPCGDLVMALSRGKARSLCGTCPDSLIIGSDQAVEFESKIWGKPKTEEGAAQQLKMLSGKEHRLLTAVCVVDSKSGRTAEALDIHRMKMRVLDDKSIRSYIERDQPLDCAGSYRVESLGIALFEKMEGSDFSAIIGLPLTKLVGLLGQFGVNVFDL